MYINGQSEFGVVRVYHRTDSVPPDNPCPIRQSMTRGHKGGRVGGSERGLGELPGGRDIDGAVQQPLPRPAAVGAPPRRPMYGLSD